MTKNEIQKLISDLDSNAEALVQQAAIQRLCQLQGADLNSLIMPGSKRNWENAAKALSRIGYPGISPVISNLLEWLQDPNWPGADTVESLLCSVPKAELVSRLSISIAHAVAEADYMWLGSLKRLASRAKIVRGDFIDGNDYDSLSLADW